MKHFGVPQHFRVPILLAVFVTLLSGWLVWDSRAGSALSNPSDGSQTYTADAFTIRLPAGLIPQTFPLEDGQGMVTFETADGKTGFQVFTLPVNEPLPATAEELQKGLPDLVVNNFENASIDGQGAISFNSYDPDIGDTFEVWFVHEALLYQVMTYAPLQGWLLDILTTWKFR